MVAEANTKEARKIKSKAFILIGIRKGILLGKKSSKHNNNPASVFP